MANQTTIQCKVSRVLFPKDPFSDGRPRFCILLTSRGKCKGNLPFYPQEGMVLNLTGSSVVYHGDIEFSFTKAEQHVPQDPRTLLEYVGKLAKGVGPATVDKIWNSYGADWQSHLSELSPAVSLPIERVLSSLNANKAHTDLVLFCLKLGFSPRVADLAWEKWGASATMVINNDPYMLTRLGGVGFRTVDAQRANLGIGDRDARRAVAAVEFALRDSMEKSGDSVLGRDALFSAVLDLGIPRDVASLALANHVAAGRIVFVGMDGLTTNTVVEQEGDLARYAVENTASCAPCEWTWKSGFTPDEAQEEAVRAVLSHRGLVVVNGGAGTGKTTIIETIARALGDNCERVSLCAFAGKAAARLREATGLPASTIHSLLQYMGEGVGFKAKSLEGETVIVDEASMVPSFLLHELTKRNPKRLVLVGDQAQLQPVGIGSPFHDIIDNLSTVVHTLTTCHRNKEAVFASANLIRNGEIPETCSSTNERFEIVNVAGPEQAHSLLVECVKTGAIDFGQDLVIVPRNGEGEESAPCTCKSLNADIQAIVNPHRPDEKFKVGDRVMCVKNFAKLDVWNGTCGWISAVDADGKPYFQSDDTGAVRYMSELEQRQSIVPAYALTVHKSQGSQYRKVFVAVLKRDNAMLMDRSMLYTAVTRAKGDCYLICDDGVDRVVGSVRRRRTYLTQLLKGQA